MIHSSIWRIVDEENLLIFQISNRKKLTRDCTYTYNQVAFTWISKNSNNFLELTNILICRSILGNFSEIELNAIPPTESTVTNKKTLIWHLQYEYNDQPFLSVSIIHLMDVSFQGSFKVAMHLVLFFSILPELISRFSYSYSNYLFAKCSYNSWS